MEQEDEIRDKHKGIFGDPDLFNLFLQAPPAWREFIAEALIYGPDAISNPKLRPLAEKTVTDIADLENTVKEISENMENDIAEGASRKYKLEIKGWSEEVSTIDLVRLIEIPDDDRADYFGLLKKASIEALESGSGVSLYVNILLMQIIYDILARAGVVKHDCLRCQRHTWVVDYTPPRPGRPRLTEKYCPVCAEILRLERGAKAARESRSRKGGNKA